MEEDQSYDKEPSTEELLLFLANGFDDDDMDVDSASVDSDRLYIETGEIKEGLKTYGTSSHKSSPKSYKSRSKQKENLLQQAMKSSSGSSKSPKSDIRENYPLRVVTAMNTVDFDAIFAMISELCTPSVVLHVNRESPLPCPEGTLYSTHIQGHLNISKYLFGLMTLDPDSVVTLKEIRFNPKFPEGLITFKTEYTATKMYNIATTMDVLSASVRSEDIQSVLDPPSQPPKAKDIIQELDSIRNTLLIRRRPVSVLSVGETILHTNKDKLIVKVVMNINLVENDLSLEESC